MIIFDFKNLKLPSFPFLYCLHAEEKRSICNIYCLLKAEFFNLKVEKYEGSVLKYILNVYMVLSICNFRKAKVLIH